MMWKVAALLAGGVLLYFWAELCGWFAAHASPWLSEHVPSLQPYLADAFRFIDANVATPLRRAARGAWTKVRAYILGAILEFERRVDGTWVRRITSYLRAKLTAGEVTEVIETKVVDWSDLPEEVRDAAIRGRAIPRIDLVKARGQNLLELEGVT